MNVLRITLLHSAVCRPYVNVYMSISDPTQMILNVVLCGCVEQQQYSNKRLVLILLLRLISKEISGLFRFSLFFVICYYSNIKRIHSVKCLLLNVKMMSSDIHMILKLTKDAVNPIKKKRYFP